MWAYAAKLCSIYFDLLIFLIVIRQGALRFSLFCSFIVKFLTLFVIFCISTSRGRSMESPPFIRPSGQIFLIFFWMRKVTVSVFGRKLKAIHICTKDLKIGHGNKWRFLVFFSKSVHQNLLIFGLSPSGQKTLGIVPVHASAIDF